MKNIEKFCEDFCFCEEDFCGFGLKNFAVLKRFNDIAVKHAEALGVGFRDMMQRNFLWVTMRIKYQVLMQPKPNQKLKLVTYPSGKNFLEYDRDYLIFDEDENLILKGTSKWCIIDCEKRRIVRLVDELAPVLPETKPIFEGKFFKTDTFEPEFLADYSYTINANDIDRNQHTNNTVYAKMVDTLLKNEKRNLKFFQINFLKESLLNDRIDLFTKQEKNCVDVLGKICEGEKSFSCHIEFE